MRILGINALNHDSSLAVLEDGELLYHEMTEDPKKALAFGRPDAIAYYERPWLKKTRHLYAGQYTDAFTLSDLPSTHIRKIGLGDVPVHYVPHHLSHAASGVFQSEYDDCVVIVADAIGEWDTTTIWKVSNGKYEKVYSKQYPYSLGLFYSAFTKLLGMQPLRDENKLMQISVDGNPKLLYNRAYAELKKNLHRGVHGWGEVEDPCDVAAAVQLVFEDELRILLQIARVYGNKLVFTGGCAYNRLSHSVIEDYFDDFCVPRFVGDNGSSIGAAVALENKFKILDKKFNLS
jgi:carbamoyltransferase